MTMAAIDFLRTHRECLVIERLPVDITNTHMSARVTGMNTDEGLLDRESIDAKYGIGTCSRLDAIATTMRVDLQTQSSNCS